MYNVVFFQIRPTYTLNKNELLFTLTLWTVNVQCRIFSDQAYLHTQQERTFIYSGLYDIVVRRFILLKTDNVAMHLLYYIDKYAGEILCAAFLSCDIIAKRHFYPRHFDHDIFSATLLMVTNGRSGHVNISSRVCT